MTGGTGFTRLQAVFGMEEVDEKGKQKKKSKG